MTRSDIAQMGRADLIKILKLHGMEPEAYEGQDDATLRTLAVAVVFIDL